MSRAEVAMSWRSALSERLDRAGVPTTEELGRDPAVPVVRAHHAVSECAAAAFVPADDGFRPTTAMLARPVALTALGSGGSSTHRAPATPADRVRGVLDDPATLPDWVADWLVEADRAARATLMASSVRWVTDALALVRRRGEPEWQSPDALRHRVVDRGVRLDGGVDALRRAGGTHLLVVRLRPGPADDRLARRLGLLWALVRGEEPASVVLGHRESLGLASRPLGRDPLMTAVEEAADDVGRAIRPSEAPFATGPGCRYCPMLADCPEGSAHVAATRSAPFPTLPPPGGPLRP